LVLPYSRALLAATRLFKSRMRYFVFQSKSESDQEGYWSLMLDVENDLLESAKAEWEETLKDWGEGYQVELETLVRQAVKDASQSVEETLREEIPEVGEILKEFVPGVSLYET
jgi:hypothetical protein